MLYKDWGKRGGWDDDSNLFRLPFVLFMLLFLQCCLLSNQLHPVLSQKDADYKQVRVIYPFDLPWALINLFTAWRPGFCSSLGNKEPFFISCLTQQQKGNSENCIRSRLGERDCDLDLSVSIFPMTVAIIMPKATLMTNWNAIIFWV